MFTIIVGEQCSSDIVIFITDKVANPANVRIPQEIGMVSWTIIGRAKNKWEKMNFRFMDKQVVLIFPVLY